MNVRELYDFFEARMPSALSSDWDNDGLMCCPSPEKNVKKVVVALDITEKVVDHAVNSGADLVISHHPVIFNKIGSLDPTSNTERKVIKLIKNDIAAFSFHTRLDALDGGVNDVLASILKMKNVVRFGPEGEVIGRLGDIEPISVDDFCVKLKSLLGAPYVNCAKCSDVVSKLAVLGGDGKDFVCAARMAGADTFVSGQFNYNIMAEAKENGITLIEAGHFFTEDPVCTFISELVKFADDRIDVEIICSNELKVY